MLMRPGTRHEDGESGQAAFAVVLMLGIFLFAIFGFAVDLTNVWFHRQAAVAASDAACQAGALDMLAIGNGLVLTGTGFTMGSASNCVSSPAATMCSYAAANGYTGTGLVTDTVSNAVAWTFPASVTGVTTGVGTYPFLQVTVTENVKTYFISLLRTTHVQQINVATTCGVTLIKTAYPMLILNPLLSGTFTYSGSGQLVIVGGPQRGVQINSPNAAAVLGLGGGVMNLSQGGPNQTGADVGVVGGPTTAPGLPAGSAYSGGSTGSWKSNVLPLPDPYANVGAPTSMLTVVPTSTVLGTWVAYGVDGCPDHTNVTGFPTQACKEFAPGYYPLGINLPLVMNSVSTAIFKPGVYYLGAPLIASGTNTLRVAKPSGYQQTDGVMFYSALGSVNISGLSGTTTVGSDTVAATDLTCDGSSPIAALGLPAAISGNVLYGQCTATGTYFDSGGDTTDSRSSLGSRGLLFFQSHINLSVPTFSASGAMALGGVLYFHSATYIDALSIPGGPSGGIYVLGGVVVDQINFSGTGTMRLALSPAAITATPKVSVFN
jgi:hypothetical protein